MATRVQLSDQKLRDLLRQVGVKIVSETTTDLLGYCCFHHNVDSPAFNIQNRYPYKWKCWNGKCAKAGNIFSLLTQKGYTPGEAKKMLIAGMADVDDLEKLIEELLHEEEENNAWNEVDAGKFARVDEECGGPARDYANSRGITDEAFDFFQMGYSQQKHMLVIPAIDDHEKTVGVVGRSLEGKQYRYSGGLRKGETIWNIQNVRGSDDTIILTEGALDSVYIWQSEWKNVGAIFGSSISPKQWKLLRKYFSNIVCFFDNDEVGHSITASIVKNVRDLGVFVVEYPDRENVKDPGDLSSEEIDFMLQNMKPGLMLLMDMEM